MSAIVGKGGCVQHHVSKTNEHVLVCWIQHLLSCKFLQCL